MTGESWASMDDRGIPEPGDFDAPDELVPTLELVGAALLGALAVAAVVAAGVWRYVRRMWR